MKSYSERLNKVTQEFVLFAGFAALEGRFRALNNNEGSNDDVDGISYGFATAGLAVCSLRLLTAMADLGYAGYKDCSNYFYKSHPQAVAQQDPFVQLEESLRGARNLHQLNVDRVNELEKELEKEREKLEKQENRFLIRTSELEKEIATLKATFSTHNNLNINLTK
jgi:hypothetical protein